MTTRRSPRHASAPADAGSRAWSRWRTDEDGAAQVVQLVLLAPLLALLMALLLHLGLFLMTRQAAITAASEGLKDATVYGATPTEAASSRARKVLTEHSSATDVTVATSVDDVAGTVTVTVTADAPAVTPGLPRTITVTQTGTHERWLP